MIGSSYLAVMVVISLNLALVKVERLGSYGVLFDHGVSLREEGYLGWVTLKLVFG